MLTADVPSRRAAGPSGVSHACLQKSPVGVEPTGKLLCRQPPYRLAPASIKRPRQESNLDLNLRRVACPSSTPRGCKSRSSPPRSRTSSFSVEDCRAIWHTRRLRCLVSRPGLEPGPGPSEGPMQIRYTIGKRHEREESNPVEQFWRLPALPGAHSCNAARLTK